MNDRLAQVGGDHYAKMGMQPFEFTMANCYDACAHSILKYVARHRDKDGAEGLKKARHCVQIRHDEMKARPFPGGREALDRIRVETFITVNGLPEPEAIILRVLHAWARGLVTEKSEGEIAASLMRSIADLIELRYPGTPK